MPFSSSSASCGSQSTPHPLSQTAVEETDTVAMGVDVQSDVVGHGGRRYRRYRSRQWPRSTPGLARLCRNRPPPLDRALLPTSSSPFALNLKTPCLSEQNSGIGFYEERSAGNAVSALMDSLAPKAKVRRDGSWKEIDSADLVPGDVVAFKIGDVVPADSRLYDAMYVVVAASSSLTEG